MDEQSKTKETEATVSPVSLPKLVARTQLDRSKLLSPSHRKKPRVAKNVNE